MTTTTTMTKNYHENSHGHQFWVGKILELLMHEIENMIKSIKVHWYNTRSQNAFTGKYTLEMMECLTTRGRRKRKRNIRAYPSHEPYTTRIQRIYCFSDLETLNHFLSFLPSVLKVSQTLLLYVLRIHKLKSRGYLILQTSDFAFF